MVGLSDIPCAGKVLEGIGDAAAKSLFRGARYMIFYKKFVNDLNSEFEKVIVERDRVSQKADSERDNGKIIADNVLIWLEDVENIRESTEEFLEINKSETSRRCVPLLPIPNFVSRFRQGREAVKMTKFLNELIVSGNLIMATETAYFPPCEDLPEVDTAFLNFQSTEDAYGKLWQALTNEGDSLILGIYGMPGVGKTRMAGQISQEALEKKIFEKVARADVGSEELNLIKLQDQLASNLDLILQSKDNVELRASQLKYMFMNRGKILIVLDDVWREIPLDMIGIPFSTGSTSEGSKILLISRDKYVCLRNNCEHIVKIETLEANEAWDMFSKTVGAGTLHSLRNESIAKDVCTKCAGLPLLIQAVGKAVKYKTRRSVWLDTLHILKNSETEMKSDVWKQVYYSFKASFDNLVEDAAPCLFLCSLYPEDDDIPIMSLIQLATGSQLVHGRSRVGALVDILKSSSLLLDGKDDQHVKMHAILRLVARSIAVEDRKYAFLFGTCGSRLPRKVYCGTGKLLHLDIERNDFEFQEDMVCSDLHTLSLRSMAVAEPNLFPQGQNFSSSMFVNLRFLVLVNFSWQQHLPFETLGKLESLFLDQCDLSSFVETGVRYFPQSLENLGIRDCLLPKPLDLSNLIYLTKLEILCEVEFAPNTISRLSNLVELHISEGFEIRDGARQSIPSFCKPIKKI